MILYRNCKSLLLFIILFIFAYFTQIDCVQGGDSDTGQSSSHQPPNQNQPRLDIDLNKPYEPEQNENIITHQAEKDNKQLDLSLASPSQTRTSNKRPRKPYVHKSYVYQPHKPYVYQPVKPYVHKYREPYVYKPRKLESELSQTPTAIRQRLHKERLRERGGEKLEEALAKQRKKAESYQNQFKEATKQLGFSIRPHNIAMRQITKRIRKGEGTEEDFKIAKDRRSRAIKSEKERTARLREARLAVKRGNPTADQLSDLKKRKEKAKRCYDNRKKKNEARQNQSPSPSTH
jgi:hypothetical protein